MSYISFAIGLVVLPWLVGIVLFHSSKSWFASRLATYPSEEESSHPSEKSHSGGQNSAPNPLSFMGIGLWGND